MKKRQTTTEIKTLTDYQHVRLRTEMYLGSRDPVTSELLLFHNNGEFSIKEISWVPAIWNAFREILDNACDEVISHGHGNKIEITYDEDNFVFSVKDNGRGIPIEWNEDEKLYIPTLVMTKTKAGRNFGERNNVAGMNGIGAAAVNFCSEYFEIEVYNSNKRFYQKFNEGNEVIDELLIEDPIIKSCKGKSGTSVTFKLSKNVFKHMILPKELLFSHIYTLASVNPHITFIFNGNKISSSKNIGKNLFGKNEFFVFEKKNKDTKVSIIISPVFGEERQETYYTLVNNIPVFDGGSFISEFKKEFFGKITDFFSKRMKKRKINISRLDVQKNLIIFFDIRTINPSFDSQSKTRFVSTHVNNVISNFSESEIKKFLTSFEKWANYIEEIILQKHEEKEDKKTLSVLKKARKEKPAKLLDASSLDRHKCILFISEGDSAISSLAAVRNPKYHAGIPLRGKIVNVFDISKTKIVSNSDLVDLINCIGLNFNEKAVRKNLRYGKVYIAHDADEDGLHIGALLINFFYKFWPELFQDEPFFYVWQTPLIIAEKGKEMKFWYSDNYKEFDTEKYKGYSITRAKGLGSLTLDHWKYCLENPHLLPLIDDGKLNETLELIFSPEKSMQRKDWGM